MSYVVGSLHPPSIISSFTTASIGYDALILSRGNEILISKITDNFITKPKIFQFFGNISSICSFDTNKLAILFETEKLLAFEIISDKLNCYYKCDFNYRIGIELPKFQLSASNTLIVCHTRIRMLQIIMLNQSLSFTQLLPFAEIYLIKCFDDSLQFIVFGKNLKDNYQVVLYEVIEKNVNQIKSISFVSYDSKPSVLIISPTKFYISIDNQIEKVEDFASRNNFHHHESKIVSIFKINDDTISLYDSKNKIYNITNKNEMITLEGANEIIPIGHNFFFETSNVNDCHILKYENHIFKIFDTFAQLNCTAFMNRSQLITKSGIIRSFVNGSPTIDQMFINIDSGKSIWSTKNFFIISTFDSTIVLENKRFSQVESSFIEVSETVSIIELNDRIIIQIAPDQIRLLKFTNDDEKPTFSDTQFEEHVKANQVSNYGNYFTIAFSDNSVSLYTFSFDEADIKFVKSFVADHEVSALAMNDSFLSVSYWQRSVVQTFKIGTFEKVEEVNLNDQNQFFASSLLYENETLIAGCSNGEVIIISPQKKTIEIHVSSSSIKLKRIKDQILIVSDVSAFIHHQIDHNRNHEEEEGEYKIEFISVSASYDAVECIGRIAFISRNGVTFLAIESSHHSHIEDSSVSFNQVVMIAVDEKNNCPTVYAVKSDSKGQSGSDKYTLFATGCKPFKLSLEIPKCMAWIFHNSDYYLAVGCQFESSGRLMLLNSKLEKVAVADLPNPIDAICSVLDVYIAVASGTTLKGYLVDDENKLVLKCSIQTRVKCASLTSPNSFAVVYADKRASASIYKMCDDQIALIASDMNPKALKFARMESETDILAIGDSSVLYDLELINGSSLKTKAAFNINCEVSAIFCSPNLAFITKSGSLQVIMKKDEIFVKIYDVMKKVVHGIGGLSIDEMRTVKKNGNSYENGCFVDGDFICLFDQLSDANQLQIARAVRIDVNQIKQYIKKYKDDLISYREKAQTHPSF